MVKIVTPKRKTPSESLPPRGAFCAFRPAKASPFGRGGTEGDGEGKDADKQLLRYDSIALTKSLLIAVQRL